MRRLNDTLEHQVEERTRERDRAWRLSQDLLVVAEKDGTIAAVNAAWSEILGHGPGDIVGRNFVDFTHPDDLKATLAAFASVFVRPLSVAYEYRFRHADGTYRWFAWTAAFEDVIHGFSEPDFASLHIRRVDGLIWTFIRFAGVFGFTQAA